MSKRAREPLFFEAADEEPEPQPATGSAGIGGPPTAVGSGLGESGGDDEPPSRRGRDPGESEQRGGGITIKRGIAEGMILPRRTYTAPIEVLTLSMRAFSCLRRNGLATVGQVVEKSAEELLALRNFGMKSYDELREVLDEFGILPVSRDEFGLLPDDRDVN